MTIEFKIGSFYRTRGGKKLRLFGQKKCGQLYFEENDGEVTVYSSNGTAFNCVENHPWDIVSEWREPHRHESVVWVSENTKEQIYPDHWSMVTGLNIWGVHFSKEAAETKDGRAIRKIKIICEEILE